MCMSCEITPYTGAVDRYITIKVWKILNDKIEVVSFVMESCRKMAINVEIEVNVMK